MAASTTACTVGGTGVVLGLEAAGTLREGPTEGALGGGPFVVVGSPRLTRLLRCAGRLDLLATHPFGVGPGQGGGLGVTLVGSIGVGIGR